MTYTTVYAEFTAVYGPYFNVLVCAVLRPYIAVSYTAEHTNRLEAVSNRIRPYHKQETTKHCNVNDRTNIVTDRIRP
jgi:hypothetical protein